MKQVTYKSIEKAILKIDNLDDDALEKISETFALSQQTLLAYVMSAALEYENEKLEGLLMYYFCLITETFHQQGLKVKKIEESDIDDFEEPFFNMLDQYFEDNNEEILDEFCNQSELTNFMAVEISTEDEDGTSLDDETATQLFIVTIALITLMSRAIID